jgi:hypothetical protein
MYIYISSIFFSFNRRPEKYNEIMNLCSSFIASSSSSSSSSFSRSISPSFSSSSPSSSSSSHSPTSVCNFSIGMNCLINVNNPK